MYFLKPIIEVRDSIEEVKVYGFIMNIIKFMPSYRYVLKHVSYECCKNESAQNYVNIFKCIGGTLYFSLQFHYYLVPFDCICNYL